MKLSYLWAKMVTRLQGKAIRGSTIDKNAYINYGSNIVNSTMEKYSYCGYDCWIINAKIGAFCSISNDVKIGGPSHPIEWVSTSPVFHDGRNVFGKHFSEHKFEPYLRTSIGNDVWIGEGAMLKAGITVGNGAVIGMGSVVTKDVGDYEIWAGNPAKLIRKRFSEEICKELSEIQWWTMAEEDLFKYSEFFVQPQLYIREYKER